MTSSLEDEVTRVVAGMDEAQNSQEQQVPGATEQEQEAQETIHIHYFPDAIVILKEEDEAKVVDSTPVIPQKISCVPAYTIFGFYFLLILSCIAFQFYCMFNPPIATVTIIPKSQTVTLSGTLQLGRFLSSLTLSQSQTVPTTGKGHQIAKQAQGYITFYNGQFQSVSVAAGTILTGASGIEVVIDQAATIPAGNPPSYGQVTVSAHAINPGIKGNIPAYDINQACCSNAVLAKNTQGFTGGQDERTFQTVAKSDIGDTAIPLKTILSQSVSGAFQSQLKPDEQLSILPCTPTVSSDHKPGQEAALVKVTVSKACSAVAYNSQTLAEKATALLSHQTIQKMGTGYSLIGTVQVSLKQATITSTTKPLVFLSFHAQGLLVYAVSQSVQQQIKNLIAGKTTQEALYILLSVPGVERASMQWDGFGDDIRLPKQSSSIHIKLFVV